MFKLFELCYKHKESMKTTDRMFLEALKNNWPVDGFWPSQHDDQLLNILNEIVTIYKLQ
jgi:hypothetical protein